MNSLKNAGQALSRNSSSPRMPAQRPLCFRSVWWFAIFAFAAMAITLAVISRTYALPEALLRTSRLAIAAVLFIHACLRRSMMTWIFVSMVIGGIVGYDFPREALTLQLITQIFLQLIKTVIAPLIFSTLVVGIAGHSDIQQLGRMGLKALIFFEVITTLALVIGVIAINISKAGVGLRPIDVQQTAPVAVQHQTASNIILHIFPENIARSVAEGQVLQVVIFSLIFGLALGMLPQPRRAPLLSFCESLSETMFKFTNIVMYLAAPAVGAAIAYTIGQLGVGVLSNLLKLLATQYVALVVFIVLVLVPITMLLRIPLRTLTRAVSEPATIAFATTSSEAALPRAMEEMEAMGVPRQVVAFVIPTGYSFNLAGSALYLSLAAIFVAQAANVHLSWQQQALLLLTLMLTSKGVAGVPRGGLVILLATAGSFNLPIWPIYIVLGVDALLDMGRTAVNVISNCLASAVVAKWEGISLCRRA